MRNGLIVLSMLLCVTTSAAAQVSVGIELPGVTIGINVPTYPQLVPIAGYPVYYAPQANSNYFFYDGMYWVYQRDNWYASSWYNGPWELVGPEEVPLFVLRVPVRYYRQPPTYFRGWSSDAPPRWGEHWGNTWEQRRSGWDNWDRRSVPRPAPLPVYQRQYSGSRYPRAEQQQQVIQNQNYRYQPQDAVVQQRYQAQRLQSAPASSPQGRQSQQQQQAPRAPQQAAPTAQPQGQQPQPQQGAAERQQRTPRPPQQAAPTVQPQGQPQEAAAQRQQRTPRAPQQAGPTAQPQGQPQEAAAQRQQRTPRPPQQAGPTAQPQVQQSQQGAAQRQPRAPQQAGPTAQPQGQQPQQGSAQRQERAPQQAAPTAKPQGQPPQHGEVQRQQQPKAQGEEKAKGSAQEQK
jgi:hypothetical protein